MYLTISFITYANVYTHNLYNAILTNVSAEINTPRLLLCTLNVNRNGVEHSRSDDVDRSAGCMSVVADGTLKCRSRRKRCCCKVGSTVKKNGTLPSCVGDLLR